MNVTHKIKEIKLSEDLSQVKNSVHNTTTVIAVYFLKPCTTTAELNKFFLLNLCAIQEVVVEVSRF